MRARKKRRWLRFTFRIVLGIFALLGASLAVLYLLARPSLGSTPEGARLERVKQSPNWNGEGFHSGRASWSPESNLSQPSATSIPPPPVAVTRTDPKVLYSVAPTGLRLTWFGHSSTLVQVDGINVLTDPFWSDRATPIAGLGPKRWYAPPIPLEDLPPIDAVVVSHDHYDHLDVGTVRALSRRGNTRFIVPLGVGAHLEQWGVPIARIVELDWWQSTSVRGVRIHATPARHYSGRLVPRGNTALWAGYAIVGPRNRVYYTGDTAYMPEMAKIGRLGPFDLVLTDSGQYNPGWPDVHLGPEQAVELASAVGTKTMVPIHWGLIRLAHHSWQEPAERTLAAASCLGVRVVIPPPGLPVEPAAAPELGRWWPRVEWRTAEETPIRSSRNGQGNSRFEPPPCKAGRQAQQGVVKTAEHDARR